PYLSVVAKLPDLRIIRRRIEVRSAATIVNAHFIDGVVRANESVCGPDIPDRRKATRDLCVLWIAGLRKNLVSEQVAGTVHHFSERVSPIEPLGLSKCRLKGLREVALNSLRIHK